VDRLNERRAALNRNFHDVRLSSRRGITWMATPSVACKSSIGSSVRSRSCSIPTYTFNGVSTSILRVASFFKVRNDGKMSPNVPLKRRDRTHTPS
jgi:hypothetical protein